jgi:hypothetical protein
MSKIKTTKIGKKDYVEVDERIRLFWELHPTWSITTEMIYNCEKEMITIFKATVLDESGRVRSTGHAREFQADKKSMVNKTSHVENCETSAIGRALGVKGIITEYGIASANEVRGAIELGKELDELNKKPAIPLAPPAVEFTSKPEPQTVAEAPKEMIDSILGKSPSKTISDELISLNSRAMKITTVEEGTAISDEYRKMVAAHGEDKLPKSLREVVVSSLNAARDKITRDQLA